MQFSFFLAAVLTATAACETSILLPLYVYPTTLGSAWNSVYDAIASHPSIEFHIILNPESGPGGSTPGFNTDWITAVSKLRSYYNVETFGYVHVDYGTRPVEDITEDINDWDAWNDYSAADISIDGIFFDETPNNLGAAGANDVAFMSRLVEAADVGEFHAIFNLGQASNHTEYFDLADTVVIFENTASSTRDSVLGDIVSGAVPSKSAILIHHFDDSDLPTSWALRWITNMVARGLSSFAIVNSDWEHANSDDAPLGIDTLADMLESIQG
ncbi:hypothetical protein diail_3132 [Diaporthe ilicicola]|nr:hypothetical protein diail_3132 [Diaporthe ilicicola]